MERDEIIRLAKEAGMGTAFYSQDNEPLTEELWGGPMRTRELIRFAHLVAAEYKRDAERYRWLREQNATLEDRTFYVGIDGRCIYPGHDWPWRVFHCLLLWLQVVDFAEV